MKKGIRMIVFFSAATLFILAVILGVLFGRDWFASTGAGRQVSFLIAIVVFLLAVVGGGVGWEWVQTGKFDITIQF